MSTADVSGLSNLIAFHHVTHAFSIFLTVFKAKYPSHKYLSYFDVENTWNIHAKHTNNAVTEYEKQQIVMIKLSKRASGTV